MAALAMILGRGDLFFNQLILALVVVGQMAELIRFVTATNRELTKFLQSVRYTDFTASFPDRGLGDSFRDLGEAFSAIIHTYQQVKIEKEAQFQFLQVIVEHIEAGILALKNGQEMVLMNQQAGQLLGLPNVRSWHVVQARVPAFAQAVAEAPKGGKRLLELKVNGELKRLSVTVTPFYLVEEPYMAVLFQEITHVINQKEIDAWNKLIRILTHEIMNSLTPLSSLTETMLMMLENSPGEVKKADELSQEVLEDVHESLGILRRRSGNVLDFLENYRKLSRIPPPKPSRLEVSLLFEQVMTLMQAEMSKISASCAIEMADRQLTVMADAALVEQVLINLLTNSVQALEGQATPHIRLTAKRVGNEVWMQVTDNGPGIPEGKLDQIFVPFFTTKKSGSGIGLSLSRNIMNLHGGTLQVYSQTNRYTVFTLIFPD